MVIATVAAVALAGCASEPDVAARSKIPPDSKIAAAIAAARARPLPAPKFTDIPKAPTTLKPPGAWAEADAELNRSGQELNAAAQQLSPPSDPNAWAQGATASSGLDAIQPPGPDNSARLEAQARAMRERATPPPPPQ